MRRQQRNVDVLNEALYFRLKAAFGYVKVTNHGQAMIAKVSRDFVTNEMRLDIEQSGEYYQVCCPYCNDTGFRLYVSYMFGQHDSAGRPMTYTAICYNEKCLQHARFRDSFITSLNTLPGLLANARVKVGKVLPAEARKKTLPGRCIPVNELPPTHPANVYLISRNLDPITLGEFYGVSYCVDSMYFMARNRIIVPVFKDDDLVGWQGRYIGDVNWKKTGIPKYFSCPGMDRRFVLGNMDVAKRYHTGIIVEGWFDVFKTGPMAMCMFGSALTSYQQRELVAVFGKRSVVYMADPEEMDKHTTERSISRLREGMSGNLVTVVLPKGTDPGKLSREYLRSYINAAAKAQGVQVSWERIS